LITTTNVWGWSSGRRLEDERLIKGEGGFLANLVGEGTLHCAFVRSPLAHALIRQVETDEAVHLPGVVAVYSAGDLGLAPIPGDGDQPAAAMSRPPLAADRVRYVGEPIAVVVARTGAEATDAAEAVLVDLEPLPVVATPETSLDDKILLFPDAGTNVVASRQISTKGESSVRYEVVASVEVPSPRLSAVTIEPIGILVQPGHGFLDIWCGHQTPHRLRDQLSSILGVPASGLRVRVPEVGGAFGLKGMLYPEYLVVAAAAAKLDRAVVWLQRRQEQLIGGTHGRAQNHVIELAGDRNGRIRRARVTSLAETGAYPHNGSILPLISQYVATGLYDIEHVELDATIVVTNRAPTGSYRGAGRPEASLAIERAVDAFAAAASLDPAEVRRRNFIQSLPHRTATGALYDSGDYEAALDMALEMIDEKSIRVEQARRRDAGADPIGLGIGAFIERAGGPIDSGEWGKVSVEEDGSVVVQTGSIPMGQGIETVWRRLVASVLAVEVEQVTFVAGDTAVVDSGGGSFGSRSAQLGASAASRSAVAVRERARHLAAEALEAAPVDLILLEGKFVVAGSPGSGIAWAELAALARQKGEALVHEEMFVPNAQTFPYGVHAALVEVEIATGVIHLQRLVAVDDCGVVLDPMIVAGQLHGSLMQGLGQALLEEIRYDDTGQPLTSTLMDYLIPSASMSFPLIAGRLFSPAPSNPLGVKGAGEAGCIGAPAAVLNAVHDALAPWNPVNLSLPLTPCKVWTAIQGKRE
jgi:carbon-monoxide dehydrogenase large subunit